MDNEKNKEFSKIDNKRLREAMENLGLNAYAKEFLEKHPGYQPINPWNPENKRYPEKDKE